MACLTIGDWDDDAPFVPERNSSVKEKDPSMPLRLAWHCLRVGCCLLVQTKNHPAAAVEDTDLAGHPREIAKVWLRAAGVSLCETVW